MTRPALDRFIDKIELAESGCLIWTGATTPDGYGVFRDGNQVLVYAHRWAYEHTVEPIPPDMQLDHLCRVPSCVLVDDLEVVTNKVNGERGLAAEVTSLRHRPDPTKCGAGLHDWVEENIYRYPRLVMCKPCAIERARRNRKRRKEES